MKKVIFLFVLLSMFQVCYVQAAKPVITTAFFGVGIVLGAAGRTTYENLKSRPSELPIKDAAKKKQDISSYRGHKTSLSSK